MTKNLSIHQINQMFARGVVPDAFLLTPPEKNEEPISFTQEEIENMTNQFYSAYNVNDRQGNTSNALVQGCTSSEPRNE
jgi:hypothetical protein